MQQLTTASQTHSGAKEGSRHLALLPRPLLIPAEVVQTTTGSCLWSGKAWAFWNPSTGRERACHGCQSAAAAPTLHQDNPHLGYVRAASGAGEEPPQK